eukprot:tig00021357_g20790.t1
MSFSLLGATPRALPRPLAARALGYWLPNSVLTRLSKLRLVASRSRSTSPDVRIAEPARRKRPRSDGGPLPAWSPESRRLRGGGGREAAAALPSLDVLSWGASATVRGQVRTCKQALAASLRHNQAPACSPGRAAPPRGRPAPRLPAPRLPRPPAPRPPRPAPPAAAPPRPAPPRPAPPRPPRPAVAPPRPAPPRPAPPSC